MDAIILTYKNNKPLLEQYIKLNNIVGIGFYYSFFLERRVICEVTRGGGVLPICFARRAYRQQGEEIARAVDLPWLGNRDL